MSKNTKIFIGILFIITLILVVYQLISVGQPSVAPTPSPTLDNVPQFPAEPITTQSSLVTFRFPSELPSHPSSLPIYPMEYNLTQNAATSIAQTIGFSNQPTVDPDNPSRLSWVSPTGSRLIIITRPPSFSLFNNHTLESPSLDINTSQQFISSFLSQIGFSSQELTLSIIDSGYMFTNQEEHHPQVVENPNQANLTQISLQYYLNGYPVFLEPKSPSSISAKLTGNNQIVSLSVSYPPILGSPINTPIIDSYLAATALQNGRGSLVNASYQDLNQASQKLEYSTVDIDLINLIYTWDQKTNHSLPEETRYF